MGEGMGNEAQIMPYISSANISCGFHAGNLDTLKKTIELALEHNVAVGAHPGYPDRENFGRVSQMLSLLEMAELIAEQIYVFEKVAIPLGAKMHHVKLHGALYNDCAKDAALSKIFIQTIQAIDYDIIIYGLSGSKTIQEAKKLGQPFANEVFADRTYQLDGHLTPRYLEHAMIHEVEDACKQVLEIVQKHQVNTIQGNPIEIEADTICIHGDGINAVEFAKAIYSSLKNNQIEITQA
ncbi:MAG: LamB/YcsF family protein [Chitinophagia bacterium]|jgi:UPF0271 protein|nr:LamB/YcsF family protein [Chitinophagia bacterium]NCA29393.1 LamB/YcsF family protein [Chitinophagia bacterium]NDD15610.1 LamB/YcsF family protein [Chitinophagia bacterium]